MGKIKNNWDRLLFSVELKKTEIYEKYKDKIDQLFYAGRISTENIFSSKNSLMSFRLNEKDRAICTQVKFDDEHILVILDILTSHKYDRACNFDAHLISEKALGENSTTLSSNNNETFFDNNEHNNGNINSILTKYQNREYLINKSKFVALDDNQSEILSAAIESDNHLTLVVNGVAGSGKTTIAESIITRSNEFKVLYVCKSLNLVNEMKKLYSNFKTNIDFCTNEELYIEEIFNLEIFTNWFNNILKTSKDDKILKYLDKQKDDIEEFLNKLKSFYIDRYAVSYDKFNNYNDNELKEVLFKYLSEKICDDVKFSNWMLSGNNSKKYDNLINYEKQTLKALYEDIVKYKQSPQDFGRKISHEIFKEDISDKSIDKKLFVISDDYIKYLKKYEKFDFQLGLNKANIYKDNQNIKGKGKQKLVDLGDIKTDIDTNRKSNIKYKYILVDESQDLSYFELHNIRSKLLEHNGKIIYFTDDNQNIADTFSRTNHYINLVGEVFKDQKAICYNLDSSYRTPVKVTKFASKLLEFKAKLIGGNLNKHENKTSKTVLDSSIYKEGIINWVYDNQKEDTDKIKQNLQLNSIDCCLIIPDEEIREDAEKLFPNSVIFTSNQVKGLEYKNVILYKFFTGNYSNNIFLDIKTSEKYQAGECVPVNYPRNKEGTKYSVLMNKFYTSVTRSENSIVIFEEYKEENLKIIEKYKSIFVDLIDDKSIEKLEKSTFRDVIDKLHNVWDKLPDEILLKYINIAKELIYVECIYNSENKIKDLLELKNLVQEINNVRIRTNILKDIPKIIDEEIVIINKVNDNQSQETIINKFNSNTKIKDSPDKKGKKSNKHDYDDYQETSNTDNRNIETKTNYTADELIDIFKEINEPEDIDRIKVFEEIITANKKLLNDKITYFDDLLYKTKSIQEKAKILSDKAYLYYMKGKIGKAFTIYNESNKILKNFDSLSGMGKIRLLNKQYEEAIKLFNDAIKCNKNSISPYYNISTIHILKKDYPKVIKNCEDTLDLFKTKTKHTKDIVYKKYITEINEYLGYSYSKLGEYNKSVQYCKKGSDSYRNIITLAENLLKIREYEYSNKIYKKFFIKYNTTDPVLYYNYAICLYKLLDYKKAIENLNIAIKLNNNSALFYEKKINCLIQLDELEEALKTCNELEESDSSTNSLLTSYTNKYYINFLKRNFIKSIYCCNKVLENDNFNHKIFSLALRGVVNKLCNKIDEAELDFSLVTQHLENQITKNKNLKDDRIYDYITNHNNCKDLIKLISDNAKLETKLQIFLDQYEDHEYEYSKILDLLENLKSEFITYIFLDNKLPSIDKIRNNILYKISIEDILSNLNKLVHNLKYLSKNLELSSREILKNISSVLNNFKESCLYKGSNSINENNSIIKTYQSEFNNKSFDISIKQKNDRIIAPKDAEISNIEKFIYFYNLADDFRDPNHLKIIKKYIELNLNLISEETNIINRKISTEKSNIDKANLYYIKACIYYFTEYYQESIKSFEESIKICPEFAKSYLGLGKSYIKLAEYDKAIDNLNLAIKHDKFLISAYLNKCITYILNYNKDSKFQIDFILKKIVDIRLNMEDIFKIDACDLIQTNWNDYNSHKFILEKQYLFKTYEFLGAKYMQLDLNKLSFELLNKLDTHTSLGGLAESYSISCMYEEGMNTYNKFFAQYKTQDPIVFWNYSTCCYNSGNYQKAIYFAEKAIKIDNTNTNFFKNKILSLFSMNDYETALEKCYQMMAIDNTNDNIANSYMYLGVTSLFLKKYKEALNYYDLILNSNLTRYHLTSNALKAFTLKIINQKDSSDILINSTYLDILIVTVNSENLPKIKKYNEHINCFKELITKTEKLVLLDKIDEINKLNSVFMFINTQFPGIIIKQEFIDKMFFSIENFLNETQDNKIEEGDNTMNYIINEAYKLIDLNSNIETEIYNYIINPNINIYDENTNELIGDSYTDN